MVEGMSLHPVGLRLIMRVCHYTMRLGHQRNPNTPNRIATPGQTIIGTTVMSFKVFVSARIVCNIVCVQVRVESTWNCVVKINFYLN
jgi:hypothetical protein